MSDFKKNFNLKLIIGSTLRYANTTQRIECATLKLVKLELN